MAFGEFTLSCFHVTFSPWMLVRSEQIRKKKIEDNLNHEDRVSSLGDTLHPTEVFQLGI